MHTYKIYDRKSLNLLAEGTLKEKNGEYVIECLVPDSRNAIVFVDGKAMQMCPVRPQKREVVDKDQFVEVYWTYGEEHTRLCDKREDGEDVVWQSKYYHDLNLHVVTKEGNDGKVVKIVLNTEDKRKINLRKIVSENNVVFDKAFGK
ncbi:MAG: hypothetical protein LBC84_02385 [Prevotellaceae bacterium]|jgi:hypothetical protein|nr:hypothetical protein [Prevotellaceae bacterium]